MVTDASLGPDGRTAIEDLGLPVRVYKALRRAEVHSVQQVADSEHSALRAAGLTPEDIGLLRNALLPYGVSGPLMNPPGD